MSKKPVGTRLNINLGDKVEEVLKPLVEIVDEKFGTNFKGCAACQRRKQWLNNLTTTQPHLSS